MILAPDCSIITVNNAAAKWIGVSTRQLVGRSFWDFVAPTAPCGELIKQAIGSGASISRELRSSLRPDRWLAYEIHPRQRDVVVAFRDITHEMVSRQFPEEGLALLQTTIDALTVQVAVLNEKGTIKAVNRMWHQFATANGDRGGRNAVGLNYLEVCRKAGNEEALAALRILKKVMSGNAAEGKLLYCCNTLDGELWFQMRVSPLKLGDARYILVIHEDVTEVRRASEDRRKLGARLLETAEAERRRIARELHDSTSQHLTAVGLHLMGLEGRNGRGKASSMELAHASLREAQREIRTLSYLLHTPVGGTDGFVTAATLFLKGFEKRTGLRASLAPVPGQMPALPEDRAGALMRVLQEALINVHKHADASSVEVRLLVARDALVLEVKDDGTGIEVLDWTAASAVGFGVGIPGMRARMQQFDGDLVLRRDRKGTILSAWFPVADSGGLKTPNAIKARNGAPSNAMIRKH